MARENSWKEKKLDGCGRFDFPENIVRVTAGKGGEALLILGSEKSALVDCGMAYCAEKMIGNIHAVFTEEQKKSGKERTLDYIFATHTHYDHIGALSAVKAEWPDARTCAGSYAEKIFRREGAIRTIQDMSNMAAKLYAGDSVIRIDADKMRVDQILNDGDMISLGREQIRVLETPGHTTCSLSFGLEPERILFLSESTGVLVDENTVVSSTLKSFEDTMMSVQKCKGYRASSLIVPHYGIIPHSFQQKYWELLEEDIREKIEFVRKRMDTMTEEEILTEFLAYFWSKQGEEAQPYDAFALNTGYEVKAIMHTNVFR